MSKIKRYVYIEVQTSLFIGQNKNLVEYRFTSYSKRKRKSFLFEYSQNQKFSKQSGKSFITNIIPIEFDELSDITETGVTFQFFYNGEIVHTHTHCPLFTSKPNKPHVIKLKQSEVQTIKKWEEQQRKEVLIPVRRRKLTENERKMLRQIFTNPLYPLDMDNIVLFERNFYFVEDNAVTPFGNIYFPPAPNLNNKMIDGTYHPYYMDDFTQRSKDGKLAPNPSLLVHEVTHAWQYHYAGKMFSVVALGCQAIKKVYDPYVYTLSEKYAPRPQVLRSLKLLRSKGNLPDPLFLDGTEYNPEALATVVEDYYYRFLRHDAKGNKIPDMGTRHSINKHNNSKNITDYIMVLRGYVLA